jgi:2-dehydropantoate 2-reductase
MRRITVFGAGAIGGHVAVRLAEGGADVSIIARGAHLKAIQANGLTLIAPDGQRTVRVRATDDPASLGPQDAVFVTLKAPSLPSLAAGIGPLLGEATPVAFVMNGMPWWYFHRIGGALEGLRLPRIDPGDAVWNAVGPARAVGGVVYSACTVREPGVVFTEHAQHRVILGEPDGSITPRARAMSAALEAGKFPSPVVADIRTHVWEKLMANIVSGPLAVAAGVGMSQIIPEPAVQQVGIAAIREAVALAEALGSPVAIDPEARIKGAGRLAHKPSILQDLEAGRPMEIDAQNVVPLELADRLGVAVPMLKFLTALLVARGRAAGLYAG